MKLRKNILLSPFEVERTDDNGYTYTAYKVKVKLINGFSGDNITQALDAKEDWNPLGNNQDRLYFLPGCSVPRFKVREAFSVTIKPEYATACFVSVNELKGSETMFEQHENLYALSNSEARSIMETVKDNRAKDLFFMLLANNNIDRVYLDKDFWKHECYNGSYFTHGNISEQSNLNRYAHKNIMREPRFQLYSIPPTSDFGKMKCDIYLEEGVLKHLNKNNLVLTKEKYQELRSFGTTEDKENIVLMMELMSNCDFQKSIVYLLFLLKEFGKPISELKESNHVNFKSLLSFMKLKHDALTNLDINEMTRILRSHNQFTRTNAMTVSMLFAGDVIDYTNTNNVCWNQGPVLNLDCETLLND